MAAPDETETWLDAWSPAAGWPSGLSQAGLEAVRALVTASVPQSKDIARRMARIAASMAAWGEARGQVVDRALFADDLVLAYLAERGLDPSKGTGAHDRSVLRRLGPPDAPASSRPRRAAGGRRAPAAVAGPRDGLVPVRPTGVSPTADPLDAVATERDAEVALAVLKPGVAERLRTLALNDVPDSKVARVRPVALAGVAAVNPPRLGAGVELMRACLYLALWADSAGRRLSPAGVFAHVSIEEFVATLTTSDATAARTAATYASRLHKVRAALGLPGFERRSFSGADAEAPYTKEEISALLAACGRARKHTRRVQLRAAVALLAGAGATTGEAGAATPDDVSIVAATDDVPSRVRVALGTGVDRRTVEVLEPYAAILVGAVHVAREHGQRFVLGGDREQRNTRLSQLCRSSGTYTVELDATRARYTFLVEAAASGRYPTVVELLAASGLSSLALFDTLFEHITRRRAELNKAA